LSSSSSAGVKENNISSGAYSDSTKKQGYKYTKNEDGVLTKEQQEQYERDGFILVKGLISSDDIDKYINHFLYLVENPSERPPDMTVVRDISLAKAGIKKEEANTESKITKFQDFVNEPILFDYCQKPEVHKVVQAIVGKGKGLQAMHTMLINKPPDTGKGTSVHPLHQDLWYFSFRPAEKIVAAWCAMEKINEENGCLVVVPGSHKTELLKHGYPSYDVNKAYHSILGIDPNIKVVSLPMEKGDVAFFHPLLWHGSGPNFSKRTRKAICCHYASTDCIYFDVKGTIQEDIEKERREERTKGNIKEKLKK